ncbi:hypothetical protein IWW48_004607 [Coemansia sp. RSA 1200]|nr:hypothetical protein IWW48_004607 [Coemansia sp. RSA 1200]
MEKECTGQTLSTLRSDPLKTALTRKSISEFRIMKQFKDNKAPITSLDYDPTGTRCITTSADESLRIYNCVQGKRDRVSYSKKYGCSLAQFTKQPGCVAYASTKLNDTVRYLSYETNQFIRYFVGHSGKVTNLQRSPDGSSTMMSAALDGTVRIWDLGASGPTITVNPELFAGNANVRTPGIAASYDPSASIVAVVLASSEIQLFDVREMKRGPFKTAPLLHNITTESDVVGVKFVPPFGDCILISMADGTNQIVDAFTLECRLKLGLAAHSNGVKERSRVLADEGSPASKPVLHEYMSQRVTVTPDGRTVITGCDNGSVVYWDISRTKNLEEKLPVLLNPAGVWNDMHQDGDVIGVCSFNPHLMECLTGSSSLALWSVM